MEARPYQIEAINAVFEAWNTQDQFLLLMATGTGKTVTFAHVLQRAIASRPGSRGMIIAHREELIWQAADKLQRATGIVPDIEMASYRADAGGMFRSPVIVASIQTLLRRGGKFGNIDWIIIDEAHHYLSPSWGGYIHALRKRCPRAKILGVTATADRLDGIGIGHLFGNKSYEYNMNQAIADGYLVPVLQSIVHVDGLDFSSARTVAGDLAAADVANIIGDERTLHQIVFGTVELAKHRQTILFAPPGYKRGTKGESYHVATRIVELLNERYAHGRAAMVTDETERDARRQIFRDFAAKKIQYLVNIGVATEGFDDPGIEVVSMARPTKSRALYTQMVGRGTRTLPGVVDGLADSATRRAAIAASSKPYVEVLDFAGNAGTHKLITTVDLLAGTKPPEVVQRAKAIAASRGSIDVHEAIEEAEAELSREEEEKRRKEAERAEQARRRAGIVASGAQVRVQSVDPFDIFDLRPPSSRPMFRNSEPPTEKQIGLLTKFGVPTQGVNNKADASALIGKCIERNRRGLATYRQMETLSRRGIDASNMTRKEASEAIANRRQSAGSGA